MMDLELQSTQPVSSLPDISTNFPKVFSLCFNFASSNERIHQLTPGFLCIGRDPSCTICIKDPSLSRRHATIQLDDNGLCFVIDLGSRNATWRNELRLKPHIPYELRPLDRITIGNVTAVLLSQSDQLSTQCTQSPIRTLNLPPSSDTRQGEPLPSHSLMGSSLDQASSDVSSSASSPLLAPVLIDTGTEDLIPNGSQFISRSPSPIIGSVQSQVAQVQESRSPGHLICDRGLTTHETFGEDLPNGHDVMALSAAESELLTTSVVFSSNVPVSTQSDSRQSLDLTALVSAPDVAVASTPCTADRRCRGTVALVFDSEPRTGGSSPVPCTLQLTESSCGETQQSAELIEESQVLPADVASLAKSRDLSPVQPASPELGVKHFPNLVESQPVAAKDINSVENPPQLKLVTTLDVEDDDLEATQPMTLNRPASTSELGKFNSRIQETVGFQDTESTQPMHRSTLDPKLLLSRISFPVVDLDTSSDSVLQARATKSPSPELEKPASLSCRKVTPENLPPLSKRGLQTTLSRLGGRSSRAGGRVSELYLSNRIGMVKFRSRARISLGQLNRSTPDDTPMDQKELGPLTGTPLGLVRRASCKPTTDSKENTVPVDRILSPRQTRGVTKANLLPIPSPIQFPDSILSEEASQLEDRCSIQSPGTKKDASADLRTKSETDCTKPVIDPPSAARNSALRSAGFDESPEALAEAHWLKQDGCLTHQSAQPVVSLSFHDLSSSHLSEPDSPTLPTKQQSDHVEHEASVKPRATRMTRSVAKSSKAKQSARRTGRSLDPPVEPTPPVRRSKRLSVCQKRQPSPEESSGKRPPAKRTRQTRTVNLLGSSPSSNARQSFKLLFSNIDAAKFKTVLTALGAEQTEDVMKASHLITDGSGKRTLKMLYARARGIPIVSVDWLLACKRSRKSPFPEPSKYLVDSLNSSRRSSRALSASDKFLTGWLLLASPGVSPPAQDLAQLCRIAGGCWMSDNQLKEAAQTQPDCAVIITTPEEVRSMVRQSKSSRLSMGARVRPVWKLAMDCLPCVSSEWLLQSIMHRVPPKWPIDHAFRLN